MNMENTLREAHTYFFVPFHFKTDEVDLERDKELFGNSIWEKAPLYNMEQNVLYPYIQDFLQGIGVERAKNVDLEKEAKKLRKEGKDEEAEQILAKWSHTKSGKHYLHVYSIKQSIYEPLEDEKKHWTAQQRQLAGLLNNWKSCKDDDVHYLILDRKGNPTLAFDIPVSNQDFMSPHLVISPLAKVGLLIFCIDLNRKNYTLPDLINLNYSLHRLGKGLEVDFRVDDGKLNRTIEKQQKQYNQETDTAKRNEIKKWLDKNKEKREGLLHFISPTGDGTWRMSDLVRFFLGEFRSDRAGENRVELFNQTRIHLFTYYQLQGIDIADKFVMENCMLDLARIARHQNDKYKIDMEDIRRSNLCTRTFQNIHIASSVEGGAMMTILPEKTVPTGSDKKTDDADNSFFRGFHSATFAKRYFWIYMMVLIQRYTLLNMIYELTCVDDDNLSISTEKLKEQVEHLSAVKVNTYFSDVSDNTQHNQFYHFCCGNLHIHEHFKEVDDKMSILNNAIRHREQQANEKRSNRFALLLGILTVSSALKDGSDYFCEYILRIKSTETMRVVWVVILIALIIAAWSIWTKRKVNPLDYIKKKKLYG